VTSAAPEPLKEVLGRFQQFVHEHVIPLESEFLSRPFSELKPTIEEKRSIARELGLWGPQIPQAYGGMGMHFRDFAHVSEKLGFSPLGHLICNCQAPDAGNMEVLHEFGTPAQKDRWLRPLAAGSVRSCFAMTEPEHPGSNPVWLGTRAVRDGDSFVLNGHKWFASSADGAAFALVMAVTDPEAPPHQRASILIVPTDTPGFQRVRNISVMGHEGEGWASHSEIRLEDCRVPADHLLGPLHGGFTLAQARLGPGRIHHCMRWVGVCERALDLMCRRAAQREIRPGVMLGSRQAIQHWIAESRVEIDASRLLVLDAAEKIDRLGAKGARDEISQIKFYVAGAMMRIIDHAIQAHGALGMSDDTLLAWFYRHERGSRIYDGADEVHKNVLARSILRRYGLETQG
jgi:acyl-CoA dehydrogenase